MGKTNREIAPGMHWVKAADYPADMDLSRIDNQLHQQKVPHRFTMESGRQALWLANGQDVDAIVHQVQSWLDAPESMPNTPKNTGEKATFRIDMEPMPATLALLALSFAGSALFYFGVEFVHPFTFWDNSLRVVHGQTVFRDVAAGEYWRLITPIFLHFSPAHSIFNALWLWYLGSMIERSSGAFRLLTLVFLVGLVSNIAQALASESHVIFGGMSGVVFGLMSYIWVAQKFGGAMGYRLSNAIFFFMTGYMLLSTFGLFNWLAGGDIADTAHIVGYCSGVLSALAIYVLNAPKNQT